MVLVIDIIKYFYSKKCLMFIFIYISVKKSLLIFELI